MTAAALDPATADEHIPPAVVAAENDVSEATAARWIRRGLRLPSGRRLRLRAERRFGRWMGGLKRSVIEHLYRVCAQCEDVGGGLFKIRVKMAIRHIGEYARDRRALWMPGTHGEENLEDNTDLSIDPD